VLFPTKTGHVGLESKFMKEEGKMVVLYSAEIPFVLREVISTTDELAWKLIGDCYVEG
jgi:hypothetical protein